VLFLLGGRVALARLSGAQEEVSAPAAIARETSIASGVLFVENDAAAIYCIVHGQIRLERAGFEPVDARAGATIGVWQTLAGSSMGWRTTVTTETRALRIDREALFDLLAERVTMLRTVFRGFHRMPSASALETSPAFTLRC
jgi:hypothetical protein